MSEVVDLTIDLYEHLFEVTTPLPKTEHAVDPLLYDIRSGHGPEPVPPRPHRFVANVDAALEELVFDNPQAQWNVVLHHQHQSNDFGWSIGTIERAWGSAAAAKRKSPPLPH